MKQSDQINSWADKETTDLFKAILKIQNISEAERFFRDLCTVQEIHEMAKRWHAARLLDEGMPQKEIITKTDLSSATITRGSYWLKYGMGGFRLILDRIK